MSNPAPTVTLVGNPNVGKTTLYNALTGASAKVGNYPGVTVERRAQQVNLSGVQVELVDVPGAYSLSARSQEEQVALSAILGLQDNPEPAVAVAVLDAGQLDRNLYLALELMELQVPMILAVTMMDEAEEEAPQPEALEGLLGVPCVAVNGRTGVGIEGLRECIREAVQHPPQAKVEVGYPLSLRSAVDQAASALPEHWKRNVERDRALGTWALLSIDDEDELIVSESLRTRCLEVRAECQRAGRDLDLELISARYAWLDGKLATARPTGSTGRPSRTRSFTERVDAWLLHPALALPAFLLLMLGLFQALFSWSDPAITLIEDGVGALQQLLVAQLPPGVLTDLLTEGIIGGVGNVVVFLPQILLLFFLLGLLEDSGYMARIAYLVDRLLRGVGLHGRAFVPMLSGLACAVPAILATRTMERQRDRLLTMMVVPLMSCSARLPVYALIIGALFPPSASWGPLPVQGLLMVGMYVFSTVLTLAAASVLGRTLIRGPRIPLLLELPPYRLPKLSGTLRMMWQRSAEFLREAGTTILAFTVIMWLLLSFPRQDLTTSSPEHNIADLTESQQIQTPVQRQPPTIEDSYGGLLGKTLEPVFRPLGFDWKLSVGIVAAFSAREVFVSTMGLVYGLDDADEESRPLRQKLRQEKRADGSPAYTPLVGASLMVFFALACQCMSTLAVVRRETGGWKWPTVLFGYMTALAYVASLAVYQLGRLLGG